MAFVDEFLADFPVWLAPMEDVTDVGFRENCRTVGARVCFTEFANATELVGRSRRAHRKIVLGAQERATAIQIYGSDPDQLVAAARIAEAARPPFIDLNCGCWIPSIVGRGAGAGWLRDPDAMIAMARRIVGAVGVPVTVKTRIGFGPESHMPIVDLARRLEDTGIAALTIHCRTAQMGHGGAADWQWAARAREVVKIPVIVNGDVRTADDVVRALAETGCAGVMIGRAAIEHPWIFREARARLAGHPISPPTDAERLAMYAAIVRANAERRGERMGVTMSRRHFAVLGTLGPVLRSRLFAQMTLTDTLDVVHAAA